MPVTENQSPRVRDHKEENEQLLSVVNCRSVVSSTLGGIHLSSVAPQPLLMLSVPFQGTWYTDCAVRIPVCFPVPQKPEQTPDAMQDLAMTNDRSLL
jgi:hypothetical protein